MRKMREVLYRAKPLKLDVFSEEDQEAFSWIYGCPLVNPFQSLSLQIFEQRDGKLCNWECDPKTLGQYIGLTDKNSKKIFEGDILSLRCDINDIKWLAVVQFGNPNCTDNWGWQLVPIAKTDVNKDILLWVETGLNYVECEIIGNIYDNLELLQDDKEWRL